MIMNQSAETKVYVTINGEQASCVNAAEILSKRGFTETGEVDVGSAKHTVKLTRYMPMGASVDNFYNISDFELVISDSWQTAVFFHCYWIDINRKLDLDGVTETVTLSAKSMVSL